MSPNNDDVVKVELTEGEKAAVSSEPVKDVKEEPKLPDVEEVKEDVKEEVKAEPKTEVKEEKKVKPVRFDDVFKVDKPEKEVKEMTVDERAEYEELKKSKLIEEHQNAYESILSTYDEDERDILRKRIDKMIKPTDDPEQDLFGKLSGIFNPSQVAYITAAMADIEEREKLEEIRSKRLNTAVKTAADKATKSAEVKKTLTEIADLSTVGETSELSSTEKHKRLIEKGYGADKRERDKILTQAIKEKLSKK